MAKHLPRTPHLHRLASRFPTPVACFPPPPPLQGAIGQEYGKYGIIRETDLYSKRPEFQLWAIEVRPRPPLPGRPPALGAPQRWGT